MTVPDTMVTLSNGILTKSIENNDHTRTDIWEQNLPHSPYLAMMAVGNWTVIKDKWRNKEVNYLVEKKFAPYAKLNFGNTPEMIEFFSNYLGVDFAWDKYAQVVVRDFVSGAMENTSATVHMEALQQTPDQNRDNPLEDYVSHELFHQWFGDLVTTKSWANITLNESFATYGEYLWREFKYGKKSADYIRDNFRENYNWIGLDEDKKLVRYDYEKTGDVFDAVSYQKGALILHMLRYVMGDIAFKNGLNIYLQQNKFKNTEVADLRSAMENATGKDLHWFFDQWYFSKGHPKILLTLEKDSLGIKNILHIQQTQNYRNSFVFPVKIQWMENGILKEKNVFVKQRNEIIHLNSSAQPDWYRFDADNYLLCEIDYGLTDIAEIEDQVNRLAAVYKFAKSDGLKFRIFSEAASLTDLSQSEKVRKSFNSLLNQAIHTNYTYTLNRALQYINTNRPINNIINHDSLYRFVNDTDLPVASRAYAVSTLYYTGISADTMFGLSKNKSLLISVRAINYLLNENNWTDSGLMRMQKEKRGTVAQAWARKLIETGRLNKTEILDKLLLNSAIDLTDFYAAFKTALNESNAEEDLRISRYFYQKFSKEKSINLLKMMAIAIDSDFTVTKAELGSQNNENDEASRVNTEKIKLYEEILKESQK
jgi:aminopeptidase N